MLLFIIGILTGAVLAKVLIGKDNRPLELEEYRAYQLIKKGNREEIIKELSGELLSENSQQIEINDKKLHVIEMLHFNDDIPLLIFIHGFGGQSSQFRSQIETLSGRYNIVAIDWVGHGKSEVPNRIEDYSLSSITNDIIALLSKRYSNYKKLVLIGHSYGTMIVTNIFKTFKHKICGLILLSPVSSTSHKKSSYVLKLPLFILNFLRQLDRLGGINSSSVARVVHSSSSIEIKSKQLMLNTLSRSEVVKAMMYNEARVDDNDYLAFEGFPLLLLGGEDDKIAPNQLLYKIRDLVNSSNNVDEPKIFEKCAHAPMYEKSEQVNEFIDQFLNNVCDVEKDI